MKTPHTPAQLQATALARKRALLVAAVALVIGVVMLGLSSAFLQLHCVMAMAVALSGGIAAARAAGQIDRPSVRRAGTIGGMYATLAYAVPFMVFNFIDWLTLTPGKVAERMAQLTPDQVAFARQNNMQFGLEYFKAQDVAYVFGYLLFALALGSLIGMLGGILARRQLDSAEGGG